MNNLRITTTMIVLPFFLILSCRKKLLTKQEEPESPPTEVPKDDQQSGGNAQKIFIPVKFKSAQLSIVFKYEKGTAIITEISGTDGYQSLLTYKENRYIIMDHYKDDKVYAAVNFIYEDGQITQVNLFDQEGRISTPTGSAVLTYNDQQQITKIKSAGTDHVVFKERVYNYNGEGNLASISISGHPGFDNLYRYTYDNKPGIFKHVKLASHLLLDFRYFFLNASKNNVISYTATANASENSTYNYQYNADGYPSKMTINSNTPQIFEITYAELKP